MHVGCRYWYRTDQPTVRVYRAVLGQIKSFIDKKQKVDWKPWANLTFGGRERAYASSHMHGMITDAQVVLIVSSSSSSSIIIVDKLPLGFLNRPAA